MGKICYRSEGEVLPVLLVVIVVVVVMVMSATEEKENHCIRAFVWAGQVLKKTDAQDAAALDKLVVLYTATTAALKCGRSWR